MQAFLGSTGALRPDPSCGWMVFPLSNHHLFSYQGNVGVLFFVFLLLLGKMINKVETIGKNAIFRIFSGFIVPLIITGLILLVVVNTCFSVFSLDK